VSEGVRWYAGFIIVALSVLVSCTGTKLVSEWKDDQYHGRPVKVFVIVASNDRGPRSLIEDEFVRQLKARGVDAVASYTTLSASAKDTKQDVLSKVNELGSDAILVIRFLKKEAGGTHTPLRRYAVPQGFDTSWDAYYGGAATDVGVRDISYDYDVITMETTLYDAATHKPLWSALSETTYQNGAIKQIRPFTNAIMRSLEHEKLVP
jgi:hypothetical protein